MKPQSQFVWLKSQNQKEYLTSLIITLDGSSGDHTEDVKRLSSKLLSMLTSASIDIVNSKRQSSMTNGPAATSSNITPMETETPSRNNHRSPFTLQRPIGDRGNTQQRSSSIRRADNISSSVQGMLITMTMAASAILNKHFLCRCSRKTQSDRLCSYSFNQNVRLG